jgi:serine/threonine-protein kinase
MAVAAALATAILGLALGYQFAPRSSGPRVYDVVLPDTAPMFFTGGSPWGEGWPALTIAPNGDFVVYVGKRGSSTELWYRSLSDTESYPIPGTEGAYQPMLSPDGNEVAFFVGDRLRRISVTGAGATTITTVDLPWGGQWSAGGHFWVADQNGDILRKIDPTAASPVAAESTVGCVLPSEIPGSSLVLCGDRHILSLVDADAGTQVALQSERGELAAAGNVLFGGHGSVVSGRYLLYVSLSGEIKAALFNPESTLVGRSATLETGIRREALAGAGQYALSASGTLAYVPGDNAEVGHLVRTIGEGTYEPLPVEPAAYQRFDLSRDGRRLAAVIQQLSGQELRIYDLETGRGMQWLRAYYIGQPRWDPESRRILADVIPEHGRARRSVIGAPEAAAPPDTLEGTCSHLTDYVSDDLILTVGITRCSIEGGRVSVDSLDLSGGFATLSPDRRWIAYSSSITGRFEVYLASFPSADRRYQVSDRGGLEPLWVSSSELVYRHGHTWYRAQIVADQDQPIREVSQWFADPRFVDTNGFSHLLTPDGSLIYVRSVGLSTASSIRVVPDWLKTMKRAVDDANSN